MISLAYPLIASIGIPLFLIAAYVRWAYYKEPLYLFSSLAPLKNRTIEGKWRTLIPFLLRCMALLFLLFALTRPRVPDSRSKISVEGIDIILVLDVSGSMAAIDDRLDPVIRLDIAKKEAISFIQKRTHDPVGLVLFSQVAVSRCPLTLDKKMLEEILSKLSMDIMPADGTVLAEGMIVAANRLKRSTAKSRIMIVLTDGVPTPNDTNPAIALELAKKLGIKIYTIGIGSKNGGWLQHNLFGWYQIPGQYNEELLQHIARETGGRFFQARNQKDMATIYNTIDELEKSSLEAPIYSKYFEYFMLLLWAAFGALILEVLLITVMWVRL